MSEFSKVEQRIRILNKLDVVTVFKIRYRATKGKRPLKDISNLTD